MLERYQSMLVKLKWLILVVGHRNLQAELCAIKPTRLIKVHVKHTAAFVQQSLKAWQTQVIKCSRKQQIGAGCCAPSETWHQYETGGKTDSYGGWGFATYRFKGRDGKKRNQAEKLTLDIIHLSAGFQCHHCHHQAVCSILRVLNEQSAGLRVISGNVYWGSRFPGPV